jgi:4-amino-4-deoxy-L-arabinose transferase-like glycosyltransferase
MKEEAVESVSYNQRVLPQKIRWLAIATGPVTGIALLSLFWPGVVLAILLMFAGIVQPRSPQFGRLVLSVVAPLISVLVIPVSFMILWETLGGEFGGPHDLRFLAMTLSWMLSPILLLCCDAALLVEARRERRERRDIAPAVTNSHTN